MNKCQLHILPGNLTTQKMQYVLLNVYCLWLESTNIKYKNFKPKVRAALAHVFIACILEVYLKSDPLTTLMQACSFRCWWH